MSVKGINIGIDLGSTNSSVFVYDLDSGKGIPVDVVSGSPLIPSVVSYDEMTESYDYGLNAKMNVSDDTSVFKAFKMLLSEKDPQLLRDRKYDPIPELTASDEEKANAKTPENITKIFLGYIFEEVLDKKGADYISNLVVGFPEVWVKIQTVGARFALREICSDLLKEINANVKKETGVEVKSRVEVRTEPECATAFCAKQIEQEIGRAYNGNLLIIDYGGGTLDITLSEIKTDESGSMEIHVLDRQGSGENHNEGKQIGNAGIIYMETVIEQAMRRAGLFEGKEIPHDNRFYAAVNALENYITGNSRKKLELTFKTNGVDEKALDLLGDENNPKKWLFCQVNYMDDTGMKKLFISYALLAKCYNEVIKPVLEKDLNLTILSMLDLGIMYKKADIEDLKIAIVGGFGRFYPVRQQIQKIFNVSHVNDKKMVKMSEDEVELAIANGACLLSEGIVKIHRTSPIGLGMVVNDGERDLVQLALSYGQEIEPNVVYYCSDKRGVKYRYWLHGSTIREFWINFSPKAEGAHKGIVKPKIMNRLNKLKDMTELPVVVGFYLDESDVVTLQVQHINQKGILVGKPENITLNRYDEIFNIQVFK